MQTRSTFLPVRRARKGARSPLLVAVGALVGALLTTGFAVGATAATLSDQSAAPTVADVRADAGTSLASARDALVAVHELSGDIDRSGLDVDALTTQDTGPLRAAITRLAAIDTLPVILLPMLSDDADDAVRAVRADVAQARARLDAAVAEKEAADAAAEAAAQAAAAAAALAAGNTVEGAKATAQQLAASQYGWGADQFSCLSSLWTKESGWNYQAYNASGGATGIPQALPGDKMASAGPDWQTNATTQIVWGLDYISRAYGSPCAAWGHSRAVNWY